MQKGSGLYDWVANNVFGANLKDGEIHSPLWTKKGLKFAKYAGPGTHVYSNISQGVEPISNVDKVAQAHDLRFGAATSPEDVRRADKKMVDTLNRIEKEKGDYKVNIYAAKLPIMAKMMLEDYGLLRKGSFSSMTGVSPENREIHDKKLNELQMQGFGKCGLTNKCKSCKKKY